MWDRFRVVGDNHQVYHKNQIRGGGPGGDPPGRRSGIRCGFRGAAQALLRLSEVEISALPIGHATSPSAIPRPMLSPAVSVGRPLRETEDADLRRAAIVLTPELTFQGESSPGRHKFKCRFRVEKPLHMRARSLGQLRVFSLRFAGKFSSAWHPFSQASLRFSFFAQPGHETDRRSVAEDPQPIGGV